MKSVLLILPHQLFKQHHGLQYKPERIILFEAGLLFKDRQYLVDFHKQKLILHRASMQAYQTYLHEQGWATDYINWQDQADITVLKDCLLPYQHDKILLMDPVDYAMQQRLHRVIDELSLTVEWLDSQAFINTTAENSAYRSQRKRWFMADFYTFQRRRLDILVKENKPVGGKWSFDADNRKKIPKASLKQIPQLCFPVQQAHVLAAKQYVQETFPDAVGEIEQYYYPTTFAEAEDWLDRFLRQRFAQFGPYEDALVPQQHCLYHSVLTPMLNIGLLTPQQVVQAALDYAEQQEAKQQPIPLSSLEGFIRQVIGWREFMRATYDDLGTTMRNSNHWQHQRSIPDSFYTGTTGIAPIDDVIKHVLQTGYCHHIERLMVLGGFMFLC